MGNPAGVEETEGYGATTQPPPEEVTAMRTTSNHDTFDDEHCFRGDEQAS